MKPWQLVISPNLDRALRAEARTIVSLAPNYRNGNFTRPDNRRTGIIDGDEKRRQPKAHPTGCSKWTFVLLEYPDGTHEVLLKSTSAVSLTNEERWHAAALVLESAMGEELFLDRIDEFELVDELEPRFAAKERPIALLRQVLVGATRSCDEG